MFNDKVVEDKKVVKKSVLRFFDFGIFFEIWDLKVGFPAVQDVSLDRDFCVFGKISSFVVTHVPPWV